MKNCDLVLQRIQISRWKIQFHRTVDQQRAFTKHLYQLIAALAYSEQFGSEWQADKEKARPISDNRHAESSPTGER
jgi:hypothetical protein